MKKQWIGVALAFVVLTAIVGTVNPFSAEAATAKIDRTAADMKVGQSLKLKVSNGENVVWSSSSESVAAVNGKGKVTAKKKGTAVITAQTGTKKLTCNITVTKAGSKKKVLVAYFSHTGTSEKIAKNIAEQTGGKLYRIEAEEAYAAGYGDADRAEEEWKKDQRPAIKNPPSSMKDYDRIILCYPIWWHTAPMTVGTFLESCDFSGKAIYPISQSASMDKGYFRASVKFVRKCAKGAAVDEGIYTISDDKISSYVKNVALK